MCACEPGFTCKQCAGTPFDPRYEGDAAEPVTVEQFEDLSRWWVPTREGWK